MRIIAGQWRGRSLLAPQGESTRPTTDRVRESLMSTLVSARGGFEDAYVLDAFAGSGALGLEALSRGAAYAVFCERDNRAIKALERNLETFKVGKERARITRGDVFAHPPTKVSLPFDLVLLDPPYALEPTKIISLLKKLDEQGALAKDLIISYEHAKTTDIIPHIEAYFEGIEHVKHKEAGKIAFDVFRKDC